LATERTSHMSPDLRYPIGEFDRTDVLPEWRKERIQTIRDLPANLAAAVAGLDDPQLDTEYRPGGWTIRQTAHHVPDSHANALIRFKLALTEDLLGEIFGAKLDTAARARLANAAVSGYLSGSALADRFPGAETGGQYWIRSGIAGSDNQNSARF